jgi:pimeloyl-ACP methyl ester carboxylesterase
VVRAYLASADWPHVVAGYREGQGIAASDHAIREALDAPAGPGLPMVVLSATGGRPVRIRRRWTALQAELAAKHGATHIVVHGSGHAVHLERPALVAEAIMTCGQ